MGSARYTRLKQRGYWANIRGSNHKAHKWYNWCTALGPTAKFIPANISPAIYTVIPCPAYIHMTERQVYMYMYLEKNNSSA